MNTTTYPVRTRFKIPHKTINGLLLTGAITLVAVALERTGFISNLGLSALTIAIIIGMVLGNTSFRHIDRYAATGVDLSKGTLLRLGIILYGFRITFQQVADVGAMVLLIDAIMIVTTFTIATVVGLRLFKMDKQTAILIGAGSSICGAAAVLAAAPIVKAPPAKVSVAVATVVIFGTLSMFIYPAIYPALGISPEVYGVFTGATIHEVAQVVAAGNAVGVDAANTAVITKMIRVMMLAPVLLVLATVLRKGNKTEAGDEGKGGITIPWFAVLFIVMAGVNSTGLIPEAAVHALVVLDTVLLTMAMAALGLHTHARAIKAAGATPILLAGILFAFLTLGGYNIVTTLMGAAS